ncbi:hypothetical protein AVO41_03770 [Thiomicrospira sp. WB1]|nr:hypothetical protein AVO41_03770 [Thiomicrospira sp. WB1]
MAMMLLILVVTPFFYQAAMQTANEMQRDQDQKIQQRLEDLKDLIILFSKYPELFCAGADNESDAGYLMVPDAAGYTEVEFQAFKPYENQIHIQPLIDNDNDPANANNYVVGSCSDVTTPSPGVEKACDVATDQNLLLEISWQGDSAGLPVINASTPVVYLYRDELGC